MLELYRARTFGFAHSFYYCLCTNLCAAFVFSPCPPNLLLTLIQIRAVYTVNTFSFFFFFSLVCGVSCFVILYDKKHFFNAAVWGSRSQ